MKSKSSALCIYLILSSLIAGFQVSAWTLSTSSADLRKSHLHFPVSVLRLQQGRFFRSSSRITTTSATTLFEGNGSSKLPTAEELKSSAESIRRQAKEMEINLLNEKLAKLERKLEKKSLSKEDREALEREQQSLQYRLNPETFDEPPVARHPPSSTVSTTSKDATAELIAASVEANSDLPLSSGEYNMTIVETTTPEVEVVRETDEIVYVKTLTMEDQESIRSLEDSLAWLETLANLTEQDFEISLKEDFARARAGNITIEDLEFVRAFSSFCSSIPSLPYHLLDKYDSLATTLQSEDPLYLGRLYLMWENYSPILFSERENSLDKTIAMDVCKQVLGNSTVFRQQGEMKKVGAAYLIEGTPLVTDGNELISKLRQTLEASPYNDRVHLFYLKDPSGQLKLDAAMEEDLIQGDLSETVKVLNDLEEPALLVTGKNVESRSPIEKNLFLSLLAFTSLAGFSGSCYVPNGNPLLTIFVGAQSPIVLYLMALFAVQHAIQLLLALKGGFSISPLPTFFPGIGGLPIASTYVSVNSPPKNNNDLFDFAFVSTFLGFLLSYGMIVVGLESTMQLTNAAEIAQLPTIDLEVMRESFLTAATIESVAGTNNLISMGVGYSTTVPLNPLAIAGFVGIMTCAIQLLPTATATNGGRMATAVLGRFSTEYGIVAGFVNIFLLVQAFRGGSSTLYLMVLVHALLQSNMPCFNDVDKASEVRLALFAISTLLALLALSPAAL